MGAGKRGLKKDSKSSDISLIRIEESTVMAGTDHYREHARTHARTERAAHQGEVQSPQPAGKHQQNNEEETDQV